MSIIAPGPTPWAAAAPRGAHASAAPARTIHNLLTVAGVDPSGGAGVLADVKTFSALGGYGCAVICALTAQNTRMVTGIEGVHPDFIRLQIDTLFDDVCIHAAKVGMLGTVPVARTVADSLGLRLAAGTLPTLVVDPVMVSKGGDVLLSSDAIRMLIDAILPLATVITPNLHEAALLLGQSSPCAVSDMHRMAERLRRMMSDSGERWVLLKGGQLPGDPVDLLFNGDRMIELSGPRIDTPNVHGTGCTLSAALTALIPQSPGIPTAARSAREYITDALAASMQLQVGRRVDGRGHGPVHHFHALWQHKPGH